MSPRVLYLAVVLIAAVSNLDRQTCRADEKAAKPEVAKLLEVGWGESFRSLQPAEEHYDRAKAAAPGSAAVPYAFALVHIKHRKHAEAAKLLDEALALDKRHLPAREARIWIDILLKKYPSALLQIEQLAKLLRPDDDPALNEAARARQRETARFLGRMLGFLDGPAQKAVNAERLDAVHRAMEERLSSPLRKEFEAGHKAITDRFEELYKASQESRQQAKAEAEESKQREAKRLAQDKEAVAKAREAIVGQAAASREELEKLLSAIDRKLSPLDRELGRLAGLAAIVRDRMAEIDREISRVFLLAESIDDPGLRLRYRLEADRLDAQHARAAADYRALEAQAARVRTEQVALVNQRDAAIGRYNAEAKRLGKEQFQLAGKEKRLARDEQKNRRAPLGNTARVRILTDKVQSFTMYEPFPLEQAKARLLESLP